MTKTSTVETTGSVATAFRSLAQETLTVVTVRAQHLPIVLWLKRAQHPRQLDMKPG